ncbi:prepilin-type N-terminal cleavage/methylation domain-containing protein [Psychrobacter aestuarii]|uniref:Prepilin-type N-terminal cleavage/methylation domain-containing protein n=1 Tax=Psychrobacter aestuarii TaxID=556327 RepID=A0ABN0VN30_9GAMM|nr:prepilin-type N-terminal cleavage/methylation domain-containing protein [Psychrobacter aestuarii]
MYAARRPSIARQSPLATQAGFTLVEVVVVVVILAVFASVVGLSVGSSEARKNLAFYEHVTDTLDYVRLLSAERMQPMGMQLQNQQGQTVPVIVQLDNAYAAYQHTPQVQPPKNNMELSADISGRGLEDIKPTWQVTPDVHLPPLPEGVTLSVQSLETAANAAQGQTLQPWFTSGVPEVLWFGTGQAAPVTIEIRYNARLVGEVIRILPDGRVHVGAE